MTKEPKAAGLDSAVTTALSRGPCPSFPQLAARYLEEYLEKISRVVSALSEEQIWWRPVSGTSSIGNLMLHLSGNLSLWVGQGLGGVDYERDRAGEFKADRTHHRDQLLERLSDVVQRSQTILENLEGEDLQRRLEIQTYETDVLGVAFHAVEHMSYHTGQILTLAKWLLGQGQRQGHGIEFYPRHQDE